MKRREFIGTMAAGTLAAGLSPYSYGNFQSPGQVRKTIYESARDIPVLAEVDVLVIGGSSGAVAAATACAKRGASVFLTGYLPYLGDDICGTYRFWLENGEKPETDLGKKIFGQGTPTPMEVKLVLEQELIDHGVDFLYSCYATSLLYDTEGTVAGVVLSTRSGRQAVKSKVIVDATHGAQVAQLAGAKIERFPMQSIDFYFTVVGNNIQPSASLVDVKKRPDPIVTEDQSEVLYDIKYEHENNDPKQDLKLVHYRRLSEKMHLKGRAYDVLECQFRQDLKDASYASLMDVEHRIRSATFDIEQTDCSDLPHYLPPYKILCKRSTADAGAKLSEIPIGSFQLNQRRNLLILGPCADVHRRTAEQINSPLALIELGERLGAFCAELRNTVILVGTVAGTSQSAGQSLTNGQVCEYLKPIRPINDQGSVRLGGTTLPVLGEYDVVVSGGGTAGAPAGLSAAMNGARTLVLEYLHGLGGIGTLGHVEIYWDGNKGGFTKIIDKGVKEMAPADHPRHIIDDSGWVFDWKMEWFRKETLKAGGDIWFGAMGCGTWVENDTVKGVVVTTPFGRGVVLCKTVIDSSGSADLAIASGNRYNFVDGKHVAMQGSGLAFRFPGHIRCNTDWTFVDESDVKDTTRMFVQGKQLFQGRYDLCKLPQTRERRRQQGDYTLTLYDILNKRRFSDTISYHIASYDMHGYTVDPYFMLVPETDRDTHYTADVPLRCLLPKGLNGLITTGLGTSIERDAMPIVRMQACLQNQGYAAGYLAATAVLENKDIRQVDIKRIQKHLVDIGSLPERVLRDTDTEPFTNAQLRAAADEVVRNYRKLEVLLTDPINTVEILSERLSTTKKRNDQLIYASILAVLGNDSGWRIINDEVKKYKNWDEGWRFTGHGYEKRLSDLDRLVISLGRTGNEAGIPTLIEKAESLKPDDYFSHFRAIAVAFENLKSAEARDVLARLLDVKNRQGHHIGSFRKALIKMQSIIGKRADNSTRNQELTEIVLARALYRCGDKKGIAKSILSNYANGMNAIYARHAWAILQEGA